MASVWGRVHGNIQQLAEKGSGQASPISKLKLKHVTCLRDSLLRLSRVCLALPKFGPVDITVDRLSGTPGD